MTNKRQIPSELSKVSVVFLVLAFIAVIDMVCGAMSGSFRFDFNILGFWIYFGLRRFSTGWRTCALVFIWISLIATPIIFVFGLTGGFILWPFVAVAIFWLAFWMYRVLTRPGIRSLFYDELQIPAA
jgi:hypothetical protein